MIFFRDACLQFHQMYMCVKSRLLFFFVFCFASFPSPDTNTDSLKAAYKNYLAQDEARVELLNELSVRVLKSEPRGSQAYASEALALAQRLGFLRGIGEAKNNLAIYHLLQGEADTALQLALDALATGEQLGARELLANCYATLGTVYHSDRNLEKARQNLMKAQAINATLGNVLIGSKILNALGGMARDKGNYDSALFFYQQALSLMRAKGEDYRVPEVLNNMGIIFIRQNQTKQGMQYYFKSLAEAQKSHNVRAEALARGNIGSTLLFMKKYKAAEGYLLQGLQLAKSLGIRKTISETYMALGQLKNETGKFDEAHVYISSFYQLKDSLVNAEKAKKMVELEVLYETEKKVHTIQLLERDNRIQQLFANAIAALASLLLIGCFLIYYFRKFRERKNLQILNLEIDRLTLKHKELSDRYQEAITTVTTDAIESTDQRLLKKVILAVEKNMGDSLFGVEEMARELAMSRTNMHRKIKGLTGFSPSELIRNIRLKRAASLLLSKADSVSQIGLIVGFEDHSYFSKSFKKHFGVAPSEYLQKEVETQKEVMVENVR
jgi:AraC-like DNA-binding protein/tetratricopeptide (TPR) repeat protein